MHERVEHHLGERVLLDEALYSVTEVARTRWGSPTYRAATAEGASRWLTPRPSEGPAPYVDAASIERFVHAFYGRVQQDPVLAPIFASRIVAWDPHLARMVHFWNAILLAAPGFTGNPMQKHRELTGVAPEDFERWLALFEATLLDVYEPAVASGVLARARRIASRLSAAMFAEPTRACG